MVRHSCRTVTDLLHMAEKQRALGMSKENIKAVIFHFNTLIWDSFVERGDGCKPIGQLTTSKSLHLSSTLSRFPLCY
uniref:Uncharacterized protein n=1 Tax=Phasianus colchicus TaxID=9054 RepID=A0A669PBZ6_PHACC